MAKAGKRDGSERYNPQAIYNHARGFELATTQIAQQSNCEAGFYPGTAISQVVNAAFAAEIYLKCYYAIENEGRLPIKNGRGIHSLEELFYALSPRVQAEIKENWQDWREKNPNTSRATNKLLVEAGLPPVEYEFEKCLRGSSDAFVKWRYMYELQDELGSWDLADFPGAIREVILRYFPEWKGVMFLPADMMEAFKIGSTEL